MIQKLRRHVLRLGRDLHWALRMVEVEIKCVASVNKRKKNLEKRDLISVNSLRTQEI